MKNFTKFLGISILGLASSVSTFAQTNVATASATANIVAPITISKTLDMVFGTIIATAAGTATLTPAGARNLVGVTAPPTAGTFNPATFSVHGGPGLTYSITLPGGPTTLGDGASHTMTVDNWASSPTPTGTLDGSGDETLTVGARLSIAAGQTPGAYSSAVASGGSGDFSITVNYN